MKIKVKLDTKGKEPLPDGTYTCTQKISVRDGKKPCLIITLGNFKPEKKSRGKK